VMFDVFYEDGVGGPIAKFRARHLAASTLMLPLSLSWNNKTDLLPRSPVIPRRRLKGSADPAANESGTLDAQ
jgi:hypothetical protein